VPINKKIAVAVGTTVADRPYRDIYFLAEPRLDAKSRFEK